MLFNCLKLYFVYYYVIVAGFLKFVQFYDSKNLVNNFLRCLFILFYRLNRARFQNFIWYFYFT